LFFGTQSFGDKKCEVIIKKKSYLVSIRVYISGKKMKRNQNFFLLAFSLVILLMSCAKNKDLTDDERNRAIDNQRKYEPTFQGEQKK